MTSTHHFYEEILILGLIDAVDGFVFASLVKNERDKEEFKKDIEMFSKTAKAIDELLGTTKKERENWQKCQDKLKEVLK